MIRNTTPIWALAALVALPMLVVPSIAEARDIHVPGDARTLRAAVRKAQTGDRIVVTAARQRAAVRVREPGITIVGSGTVLRRGALRVDADDVTIEGFEFAGARLIANANGLTLRGNRFIARGRRDSVVVNATGHDATIADNTVQPFVDRRGRERHAPIGLRVVGDRAEIENNEVYAGTTASDVRGENATVIDNHLEGADTALVVDGHPALVHRNALVSNRRAIRFAGDGTRVAENSLRGRLHGVVGTGDAASVTRNDLTSAVVGIAIDGDGATITDNELHVGGKLLQHAVHVTGDDAEVRRNHALGATGVGADVVGESAAIANNHFDGMRVGVRVEGDTASIQANTLDVMERALDVTGNDNLIAGNEAGGIGSMTCPHAVIELGVVSGDHNEIRGNQATHLVQRGLTVRGNSVVVTANEIDGAAYGIDVEGATPTVTDNRVTNVGPGPWQDLFVGQTPFELAAPGLLVCSTERGGQVSGNDVTHRWSDGIVLELNGAVIEDNVVESLGAPTFTPRRAIVLDGSINELSGNAATSDGSDVGAVLIRGDSNYVHGNQTNDTGGDGFVIEGNENALTTNVASSAAQRGYTLTGTGNAMTECTAEDCGAAGLVNFGSASQLVESTFQGNALGDVENRGSFAVLIGNVFGTGLGGSNTAR